MDAQELRPNRRELSPVDFLERSGAVHPSRTAIVDGTVRYDYRTWRARSRRFASALRRAQMGPGDRVAFLALNSEPLSLAHFAVPLGGGVLVAINTRLNSEEVAWIVEHSGADRLFYSPELKDQVGKVPASVARHDLGSEFEDFLASGTDGPLEPMPASEDDTITVDYTSGTTGNPKGVMYSHRGAYLNALAMAMDFHLDTDSRYLWVLPMFHCSGWCFHWALAAVGGTGVCLPRFDPPKVWELLETEGITHLCGAPTVHTMLVNDPAARRLDQRVTVAVGGAPPSPTLIARMDELNLEPVHVYGLTESYGPFTINVSQPGEADVAPEERARFKSRQGVTTVCAGEVRVVDEAMQDVPADASTMGDVVLRGNVVMKGYYRDPEGTEDAFRGGWFHTGDVGVMHPDGSIELRDRRKDIIICGGENISTIEVEQAIVSHPAVLEAAVVAVPDELWGEVPKAFVTLKAGMTASEDEIIEHCRSRIAHFKCPKTVEFKELPKTSTGKVQKFLLRETEWAGRDKRIH